MKRSLCILALTAIFGCDFKASQPGIPTPIGPVKDPIPLDTAFSDLAPMSVGHFWKYKMTSNYLNPHLIREVRISELDSTDEAVIAKAVFIDTVFGQMLDANMQSASTKTVNIYSRVITLKNGFIKLDTAIPYFPGPWHEAKIVDINNLDPTDSIKRENGSLFLMSKKTTDLGTPNSCGSGEFTTWKNKVGLFSKHWNQGCFETDEVILEEFRKTD